MHGEDPYVIGPIDLSAAIAGKSPVIQNVTSKQSYLNEYQRMVLRKTHGEKR